ncbi:MAG: hypothetical protein A2Y50_07135 [Pseudomonadales bacterium RIFCSPLOWO2_12_59_9]|nr:MAG: hypothetical protein A2Y50_07135 [Pseudomonadales bacterium RIFCSPLOWO2_12_59_9]
MLATLLFTSFAFAAPTYNVCNKQKSTINTMPVLDCVFNKNQPWNMEAEVPDLEDGGTKLIKVNSAYIVRCNNNHRCGVVFSDTIKKGAVVGNSPPGDYRLDYDHYIDVDAAGNATEYLRGTGPLAGGAVARSDAVPSADGKVTVSEASCEPLMDDACTINHKPVAKADLGKYLPAVNEADVQSAGGFCEYPICYNSANNPVGIRAD